MTTTTGKFAVTSHDLVNDQIVTEEFDDVVVATGHFSTPNVPEFEGFKTFNGRILHAHDFRDALEFKGQDILIIGRSYSAEDIGSQCYKYGAHSVTASYRSRPMGFNWPAGFEERAAAAAGREQDGAFQGRQHEGWSTPSSCAPATSTTSRSSPTTSGSGPTTACGRWASTKASSGRRIPKLFYIGMQDQFYTFNMFDAQAWFARDVIMGRIKLPSQDAMRKDSAAWRAREEKLEDAEQMIWFQGDNVQGADRRTPTIRNLTSRARTAPSWSGSTTRPRTSWHSATTPIAR